MSSRRVDFVWPVELVDRIDVARGRESRSSWVQWALESALSGRPVVAPVAEGAGKPAASSRASVRYEDVEVPYVPAESLPSQSGASALMWERQQRLNRGKK